MKYIRVKSILCVVVAASFLYAEAQTPQVGVQEANPDSLETTQKETVQVAFRKVNQNDLLGGVSFVNVE